MANLPSIRIPTKLKPISAETLQPKTPALLHNVGEFYLSFYCCFFVLTVFIICISLIRYLAPQPCFTLMTRRQSALLQLPVCSVGQAV